MPIHSVRGLEPPLGREFELLCEPLEAEHPGNDHDNLQGRKDGKRNRV
jgi:hypothetical protein